MFENKRIHPLILDNSFDNESAVVSLGNWWLVNAYTAIDIIL
jgi:hypothetical protein